MALDYLGLAIHESLLAMVWEHKHRTGNNPQVILAEYGAFYRLRNDIDIMVCANGSLMWRGIPLRMIANGGISIYLCGDPIPIRGFEEYRGRYVPPEEV